MTPEEIQQLNLAGVKQHLAIAFVLGEYGVTPESESAGGRLHYYSPFRETAEPTLDVFSQKIKGRSDPEERWGDWSEDSNGDVIDLIERYEQLTRPNALARARILLGMQESTGWNGPTVKLSAPVTFEPAFAEDMILKGVPVYRSRSWANMLKNRPGLLDFSPPSDTLFRHSDHDTLVYVLRDNEGDILGVRYRNVEGQKYAMAGSSNILMRMGAPAPELPVFLCEGETDTWAAWTALKGYEVLGVPGASNNPEKLGSVIAGREVYLAFDPDPAGANGRAKWANYLQSVGSEVHTVILPEGKDIASLQPEVIRLLPGRARHLPPAPDKFVRQGDQYYAVFGKGDDLSMQERSNWSFEPTSLLISEEGDRAYRGLLHPGRRQVTLPASSLSSAKSLRTWGSPLQARWYGNDSAVQQLAALIDHEAAFLPEGRQTDQVGLHSGTFVTPSLSVGEESVEFVPTTYIPDKIADYVFLKKQDVDPIAVISAMLGSQHTAVTGPVLAWLAAAPLRTRFQRFPFLSVTGVSGTGKSTLVEAFLQAFTSSKMTLNLTSTTAYAVEVLANSSNAFPVWFDEYRPGARDDTLRKLDQILRDAYMRQAGAKGGGEDATKLKSLRTDAPFVVSGEDNFTETSHLDRLVPIRLRTNEMGDLQRLLNLDTTGFAHKYLTWLTTAPLGEAALPPVFSTPVLLARGDLVGSLNTRQIENVQVLDYGWRLLGEFLGSINPEVELGTLDLSRILLSSAKAAESNPIVELLRVLQENDTKDPTVWVRGKCVFVHVQNVLKESKQFAGIVLPTTNASGIISALVEEYGASASVLARPPKLGGPGTPVRTVRIPLENLNWDLPEETGEIVD
jgi:hypothetical protein